MIPEGMVVGDTILVETDDGKRRDLKVVGLTHESNRAPAPFSGQGFVYVDFETLEWLGGDDLSFRCWLLSRWLPLRPVKRPNCLPVSSM